jgi:protein-L-isoaspartate(D-aspartate) O-methyltransferase
MNLELARTNMVEQQIRPWDVLDREVLDLVGSLPREDFVPDQYQDLAFSDIHIPLMHGQFMLSPKVEARILQALAVRSGDTVLEVGTGSGYFSALLASQASTVCSIDIFDDFTAIATTQLGKHGFSNVHLENGDASRGWSEKAPFDVIAVTGAVAVVPDEFRDQLQIGGRLFVVVGEPPAMEACLITRVSETEWSNETLFETELPFLVGAEPRLSFAL